MLNHKWEEGKRKLTILWIASLLDISWKHCQKHLKRIICRHKDLITFTFYLQKGLVLPHCFWIDQQWTCIIDKVGFMEAVLAWSCKLLFFMWNISANNKPASQANMSMMRKAAQWIQTSHMNEHLHNQSSIKTKTFDRKHQNNIHK